MRWFTDAAYEADDVETWDAMLAAYEEHLATIAGSLPPDLAALATDPSLSLHDARIRRVEVDRNAGIVMMSVLLGDGRVLRLRFGSATFTPDNVQVVAYAVGATYMTDGETTYTTIRAHEVDVDADGRYLLRLRLWPFGEFGMRFSSFSLSHVPASADGAGPGNVVISGQSKDD